MDIHVLSAEFVTTAVALAGCPPPGALPEVAFVGRSNVGKSSLINALCRRRKLVRVSNTPGRTRALNFFKVNVRHGARDGAFHLCDLPGYGFAKVSKAERASWQKFIEGYLTGRQGLGGVVQIIDAEIGPTPLDLQVMGWLGASGRPLIIAATKLDRLTKAQRLPALRRHAVALQLPESRLFGVSSTAPLGLDALWRELWALGTAAPRAPAV